MSRQESQPVAGATHGPLGADNDLNLREYLEKIRRSWKLVLVIVLASLAVAAVQFAITPEEYEASVQIQIERRSITPFANSQSPWLDNWWNLEYYPTQYKLLESRGLAETVVQSLRLAEDPAFNPALAHSQRTAGDTLTAEDDYVAIAHLADVLRAGLIVEPVAKTQLVNLRYRHSSREFAAKAANGFADVFIARGIASRTSTAGKASRFLSSQIDTLKTEIAQSETEVQKLQRSSDVVALGPQSSVTTQRLEALNRDYIESVRDRSAKQARYEELASTPDETVADAYSNGLVEKLREKQLELEREYQTKLQRYRKDWPEMLELEAEIKKGQQNLDQTVQDNSRRARQAASAEYQTALRQERSLSATIEGLKGETLDQRSAAVQFNIILAELESKRELLDELTRQHTESGVSANLQETKETNVSVVDRALVPGAPFRPNLRRNLTLGLVMGLLFGVGAALGLDFLDRTIKTPDEIERLLRLPTLAVIPDISERGGRYGYRSPYGIAYGYGQRSGKRGGKPRRKRRERKGGNERPDIELVPHRRPRLAVSEAYRSLRTALLLSSAEELRLVAVTSAGASEGKTVTASNLAVVMAQLGRRTLLIDADLRRPRVHEVFGISNRVGLVNCLTGNQTVDQIFQRSEIPGLYITPSGPIPPNPSELLSSERMGELLNYARTHFHMVIIDTPPVLAVTDATLLGARTDGLVLCARGGRVQREDAKGCVNRLRQADVRILGAVLNGYRADRSGYRGDYHHYEAYAASDKNLEADSAA